MVGMTCSLAIFKGKLFSSSPLLQGQLEEDKIDQFHDYVYFFFNLKFSTITEEQQKDPLTIFFLETFSKNFLFLCVNKNLLT